MSAKTKGHVSTGQLKRVHHREATAAQNQLLIRHDPLARSDDADLFAIEKGRLRDHVTIADLLRSGRFVEHEKVRHLTTTRVVVTTDGGDQAVNLDGEIGTTTPARFLV